MCSIARSVKPRQRAAKDAADSPGSRRALGVLSMPAYGRPSAVQWSRAPRACGAPFGRGRESRAGCTRRRRAPPGAESRSAACRSALHRSCADRARPGATRCDHVRVPVGLLVQEARTQPLPLGVPARAQASLSCPALRPVSGWPRGTRACRGRSVPEDRARSVLRACSRCRGAAACDRRRPRRSPRRVGCRRRSRRGSRGRARSRRRTPGRGLRWRSRCGRPRGPA
jgi:hypothetical protein